MCCSMLGVPLESFHIISVLLCSATRKECKNRWLKLLGCSATIRDHWVTTPAVLGKAALHYNPLYLLSHNRHRLVTFNLPDLCYGLGDITGTFGDITDFIGSGDERPWDLRAHTRLFFGVVVNMTPSSPHKANYREFLRFHQPIPIQDEAIRKKVHHTYRLQFLKDVVLARALDDSTFKVLNSCIIFSQIDIINHAQGDPIFLYEIVRLYASEEVLPGPKKDPDDEPEDESMTTDGKPCGKISCISKGSQCPWRLHPKEEPLNSCSSYQQQIYMSESPNPTPVPDVEEAGEGEGHPQRDGSTPGETSNNPGGQQLVAAFPVECDSSLAWWNDATTDVVKRLPPVISRRSAPLKRPLSPGANELDNRQKRVDLMKRGVASRFSCWPWSHGRHLSTSRLPESCRDTAIAELNSLVPKAYQEFGNEILRGIAERSQELSSHSLPRLKAELCPGNDGVGARMPLRLRDLVLLWLQRLTRIFAKAG
ncbi:hypothetical protein PAXINDRAFT_178885 [Paxillus involutus ATCC 200175]|nr:hypothetical protein PAXINDRAFT_178885 [Paxillus involutus ATCC 200175]